MTPERLCVSREPIGRWYCSLERDHNPAEHGLQAGSDGLWSDYDSKECRHSRYHLW